MNTRPFPSGPMWRKDFDPDKHILMRGKAKQVHVITRGFSYTNNLGNTEVIKAEVRSADSETDELGGTK